MPLLFGILLVLQAASTYAACYTPAGYDHNLMFGNKGGDIYKPCGSGYGVSMCCANGPRGTGDICTSTGLCYNNTTRKYSRQSCTDRTWNDPACIKLFMNGTGIRGSARSRTGFNNITDVDVTPCDDGSWCYGSTDESAECCLAGGGIFLSNGIPTKPGQNTTMAMKVAGGNANLTSEVDALARAEIERSDTLRWGITIAVAAAIAVVVVLMAFGIRRFVLKRKAKEDTKSTSGKDQLRFKTAQAPPDIDVQSSSQPLPEMGLPTPKMGVKMRLPPLPASEMGIPTPRMGVKMHLKPPPSTHIRYELEG